MGALGERFRQARLDRHLTLQDAQRETRIHRRFLEALENDDLSILPAPVYARGFIRTYSEYLGIEAEPMVALYLVLRGQDEPLSIQSATTRINNPKPFSMRLLGIGTGVVLLLLLFGYLWSQYNSFVESVRQAEATATPRGAPGAVASPFATPVVVGSGIGTNGVASPAPLGSPVSNTSTLTPVAAPTPVRGIQVEVRITERSWLAVWVDGQAVLAEESRPGFTRTFAADQSVRMRVGNAVGVVVTVNGNTQGALGARGQAIDAFWGRQ
ncbi:MAG: RodZ domain-containing protein [Chloroflexota bacterium]